MSSSIFKSIGFFLFNLKQTIFPHVPDSVVTMIHNTNLFNHLDPKEFNNLLKSSKLIKYSKDKLIVREGEEGDALYIIVEGSVRVFTISSQHKPISLARLNAGDYFGEQALIGKANKTRNANIETITDTTLIKIKEKFILELLNLDKKLKLKFLKPGFEQALNTLSLPAEFYSDIKSIILQIESPTVMEMSEGDIIFEIGAKPDNVYFILQGKVEISIRDKTTKEINRIILHKGHIFGELGVLRKQPRAGTAIARGKVRLLTIDGEYFAAEVKQKPNLQEMLSTFYKVYQLPIKGVGEQYIGEIEKNEKAITTIFKIENGQVVISSQLFNQDIFIMSIVDVEPKQLYQFKDNNKNVELGLYNKRFCKIRVYGTWDDLHTVCGLLLNSKLIDETVLANFEKTGELKLITTPVEGDVIICDCTGVTKSQLEACIQNGMKTVEELSQATGACTVCGSCEFRILELLGENPWLTSIMEEIIQHNSNIKSYLLKPLNAALKPFIPGQHVIVQVKIDDVWIERPYSISDIREDGNVRITIKKEEKGLMTQWLFSEAEKSINVNVAQPQGSFTLNLRSERMALCIAGGVGITPFIMFAKFLLQKQLTKNLHILYCASYPNDFVCKDEFTEIASKLPTFSITYRTTRVDGPVTSELITDLVKSNDNPEIYICGSEGFTDLILAALKKMNYDNSMIFVEQFVHAGASERQLEAIH